MLRKKMSITDLGGRYTNLFEGKEFLIKELFVKPKGILSLQKHHHRAEHWLVTQGNAKITLNKDNFTRNLMNIFLSL
jgi:mannose-1-phosphate guanylyltransferase/mannose-6-phosphate isomerase